MDWLTLQQAAEYVGPRRGGKPTSRTTLYRWAVHGLRGLYLYTSDRGGILMTTREHVDDFFAGCREAKRRKKGPCRSPARRARDHVATMQKLKAMGAIR